MKKLPERISVLWLPVVFAAGILLGCLITSGAGGRNDKSETAADSRTAVTPVEESLPVIPDAMEGREPESGGASTGPEAELAAKAGDWSADAIYNGGDQVLYEGKYYTAKWWTQNEIPGNADVWEDTGEAPPPASSGPGETGMSITGDALLPRPGAQPQEGDFRIVAYYPSWAYGGFYTGTEISDKVQFDKVTHLVYAFAIPTGDGTLRPLDNEAAAVELIETAHEYGVKVMLAVGGWSYNDIPLEATFVSATETREKRELFAQNILDMCGKYGFDGIDLDWEHPRVDGSSGGQYESLVELLAGMLHDKGLLLSCAVLSGATADGNIYYDAAAHTDRVLSLVDWINVMAYDGGDGERHSTYEFAAASASYWRDTRGVPAGKINLGVPFYSRPGWASYGEILEQNPDAWKKDVASYNGMEVWYNGVDTIRAKTEYALENLGGIMIWEITQDTADRDKSLLTAVWEASGKD